MTEHQKEQITKLRTRGLGYGKIAQTVGVPVNTVKSFCRRNDMNGQTATVLSSAAVFSDEVSRCENCGREIRQIAKHKKKRFCCDKCRNSWWNSHLGQVKRKAVYTFQCPHCGKDFHIYGDKRRKYCSHDCYIAERFKGGDRHE